MNKRFRYIFYSHKSISLVSILICVILFTINYQGSLYSVDAAMRKTFTPRISIYEQYDDNIDLVSNLGLDRFDKNSDWVTMVSPGFSMNLDSPKTKMSLDYETRLTFYHREKNQKRDTDLHYGTAQWEQKLSRNIKLNVRNNFSRSDDPILVSEEGLIEEVVERRIYYHNNGQISLSMRFGVYSSMDLGYRNLYLNNKSNDYEDSIGNEFFFNLDTKLNTLFDIGFEFRINRGKFKQSPEFTGGRTEDFYDHEGVITLSYRWHPSLRLFARYSLLNKKFDETGQDLEDKDFQLYQGSLGLNLILSPHTNFSAEGGYFLEVVDKGRIPKDRRKSGINFNIFLNTQKKKAAVSIGGSGGYSQEYFTLENLGSSEFRQVFGSVNYSLSKELNTFLSANYQWNEFLEDNQGNRKDEVWQTIGGFYYSFSYWLTLFIEGTHSERKSESDMRFNRLTEFIRDNRVMLRLTAAYPIKF